MDGWRTPGRAWMGRDGWNSLGVGLHMFTMGMDIVAVPQFVIRYVGANYACLQPTSV